MAAAEFLDIDKQDQELLTRWMMAGHDVIAERMTFRHKSYKKDLCPDTEIKHRDGSIVLSFGKPVKVGDVLPERADLALDIDGKVLGHDEFKARYLEYLRWFKLVEGSDPEAEPIPDPLGYVLLVPDTFSDSRGMVNVHYDARKPAEEVRTHLYDPVNDRMVEIKEALETSNEAIKYLLEQNLTKRGPGRPRKDEA